jgi:8-oxo-dGTP pyrophosphatase MutT (NUDIX family)
VRPCSANLYVVSSKLSFLGLIDEGETPEQAAIRELEEETGYKAEGVEESSPVIVSDPGEYSQTLIQHFRTSVNYRNDKCKHEAGCCKCATRR